MGCDIHIVTEIKENGKWKGVDEFPNALDDRNYHLFSFLANVRNYFNTVGFKPKGLPEDFLINHVSSTFVETVKWWIQSGMKETAETVASYFLTAIRF